MDVCFGFRDIDSDSVFDEKSTSAASKAGNLLCEAEVRAVWAKELSAKYASPRNQLSKADAVQFLETLVLPGRCNRIWIVAGR